MTVRLFNILIEQAAIAKILQQHVIARPAEPEDCKQKQASQRRPGEAISAPKPMYITLSATLFL